MQNYTIYSDCPLWTYYSTINAVYSNSTSRILLSRKKLKAFPLITGTKQGYPPSLFLFNVVLEVLATMMKQMREIGYMKRK